MTACVLAEPTSDWTAEPPNEKRMTLTRCSVRGATSTTATRPQPDEWRVLDLGTLEPILRDERCSRSQSDPRKPTSKELKLGFTMVAFCLPRKTHEAREVMVSFR